MKLKPNIIKRIKTGLDQYSLMDESDVVAAKRFYENTSEREQITICMATHPPKGSLWKNAYMDLRCQCDRFILVLGGGYTEVPGEFLDKKQNATQNLES